MRNDKINILPTGTTLNDEFAVVPIFPRSLNFGETIDIPANCAVLEAEVITNKGNWTFTGK
jgi:hypothetical protein